MLVLKTVVFRLAQSSANENNAGTIAHRPDDPLCLKELTVHHSIIPHNSSSVIICKTNISNYFFNFIYSVMKKSHNR